MGRGSGNGMIEEGEGRIELSQKIGRRILMRLDIEKVDEIEKKEKE